MSYFALSFRVLTTMDEDVLCGMSTTKSADVSPSSPNERQFVGDLGNVTYCVSNYMKEVMKVSFIRILHIQSELITFIEF